MEVGADFPEAEASAAEGADSVDSEEAASVVEAPAAAGKVFHITGQLRKDT